MSTLAAARADNFYFPPEWDPKKGGLNKQQGQHPLRERAKKLDQGILVIRYASYSSIQKNCIVIQCAVLRVTDLVNNQALLHET